MKKDPSPPPVDASAIQAVTPPDVFTQAVDGDTITLPSGTFSWTVPVNISKAITLKGETTIAGTGTAKPTVTSSTIVKDNIPRGNNFLAFFGFPPVRGHFRAVHYVV